MNLNDHQVSACCIYQPFYATYLIKVLMCLLQVELYFKYVLQSTFISICVFFLVLLLKNEINQCSIYQHRTQLIHEWLFCDRPGTYPFEFWRDRRVVYHQSFGSSPCGLPTVDRKSTVPINTDKVLHLRKLLKCVYAIGRKLNSISKTFISPSPPAWSSFHM